MCRFPTFHLSRNKLADTTVFIKIPLNTENSCWRGILVGRCCSCLLLEYRQEVSGGLHILDGAQSALRKSRTRELFSKKFCDKLLRESWQKMEANINRNMHLNAYLSQT